jgi:hypothetical protein
MTRFVDAAFSLKKAEFETDLETDSYVDVGRFGRPRMYRKAVLLSQRSLLTSNRYPGLSENGLGRKEEVWGTERQLACYYKGSGEDDGGGTDFQGL